MKWKFLLAFVVVTGAALAQPKLKTENIILITLDGLRWQEVFNGAENRLITKKFVRDTVALATQYATGTPEERRQKLMPFLWNTVARQGQIYGNRHYANYVNVTNRMWFSYPGYNELLTGAADDIHINTNDPIDNPNKNVLEFINQQTGYKGKVAAFTSWENFPWIINAKRSGVVVNAGWMKAQQPNETEKFLNNLSTELPHFLDDTRLDAFTFHYAFEYLKKNKPKVVYISFNETDHFAHEGEYDRYLNAANYADRFISDFWTWLQSQPQYKNKTTLIITVDHGRGNTTMNSWRSHGEKVTGADQIWFAVLGPDTQPLGEIKSEGQYFQNQLAKTLAAFLGFDYVNDIKPGAAIESVLKK